MEFRTELPKRTPARDVTVDMGTLHGYPYRLNLTTGKMEWQSRDNSWQISDYSDMVNTFRSLERGNQAAFVAFFTRIHAEMI
jgi:phage host-nuclease inhibitor protein Gam